jgi:hypothetical protein
MHPAAASDVIATIGSKAVSKPQRTTIARSNYSTGEPVGIFYTITLLTCQANNGAINTVYGGPTYLISAKI